MSYKIEPNEFAGKTALITGATSGIGAATAVALARLGCFVVVHGNRNREGAEETLGQVRQAGSDGVALFAELDSQDGIKAAANAVKSLDRPVDILVNNAGSLIARTPVLDFTMELWEQVICLNLTSAFFLAQAVLPGMVARGRGCIVNVTSLAARTGGGLGALAYASAKGAVSTMTRGLAREFAPKGIVVNAVSPGTIDTNYHRTFSTRQALDGVVAATPAGRLGSSEEVADVIVFLCSEGARFVHGEVIEVNGGFFMA
jgi:3-oxoacyl-[acyl-carrier protein] reductase